MVYVCHCSVRQVLIPDPVIENCGAMPDLEDKEGEASYCVLSFLCNFLNYKLPDRSS